MNNTALRNGMPQCAVFKDPSPLTEDFIPKVIPYRDKQIENILYHLSGLIRYGILMNNIVVYGHPGTGKTHSVKNVLENIDKEINSFYGQAYRSTSAHAFFRSFMEKNFDLSLHPRESISVYYSAFERATSDMKNILIVFDDIQYLLHGDPKGLDGLLFYLSRLGKNLGLILIGNIGGDDLSQALAPPTNSSLKIRSVYFPKYNAAELRTILKERARVAFTVDAFKKSSGAIAKIAALTAQSWGSARFALDLLKEAAIISEIKLNKGYISEAAVDQAQRMLESSNIEELIRELPMQVLAVLEAVYRLKSEKNMSTGNVFSFYEKVCSEWGYIPFSLRKVSDIITELDFTGLIRCILVSRGRFGRTRLINWPSNDALEKIYERERNEKL